MIKIYNTLTQQKEIFQPIEKNKVTMYVCGVTVYDYCHLGHARTYVGFDIMVRYFLSQGYDVHYVRNITDIDDKIIKRSQENNEDFTRTIERFIQAMHEDFSALNLLKPTQEPRATQTIAEIIAFIEKLIVKGYAYVADNGDVYYKVRQFAAYGALSHRDIDQLESGARVDVVDVKLDPLDFVLWKLAKPNEPSWDSPWGKGRPGWHIECSAMSMQWLGENFDIHGGGQDLIFPHHENEIAQSEAVTGKKFANVWLHTGFLQINKEKMSKSLGNFFTVRDILKNYDAETLRYFFVASHYRSQLSYAEDALQQARNALERFYLALRDLPVADPIQYSEFEKKFNDAMADDFNTPVALSVLFELAHEIQRLREHSMTSAAQHGALLKKLANVLGILQRSPNEFLQGDHDSDVKDIIENLIVQRNQARAAKDWKRSDDIRKELQEKYQVELQDGDQGTTWRILG